MNEATTSRIALTMVLAAALLCAEAHAAPQSEPQAPETKSEPTAPGATNGTAEPPAPDASAEAPPEAEGTPASLGDLTREGFEIIATDFIPAEAVTRQSGKVSSDAIVVTLQKQNATAVCFYTLKAYVGKKLTTIPACTVHR